MIKTFVIDACVARSAGETDHPVSSNCRKFLEMFRDSKNLVVFNSELTREWNKHQSGYSKRWRTSMFSRRRATFIELKENERLRELLFKIDLPQKLLSAVIKDLHLIEVALVFDKIIISRDNTMREILWFIIQNSKFLNEIIWLNPSDESDFIIEWFTDGVKITKDIYLVSWGKDYFDEAASGNSNPY